jgi:hypothetical protein
MANITAARNNIEQEEVEYGAAVSESTFTKIGGSINHINTYQNNYFEFGILRGVSASGSPTYNNGWSLPLTISDAETFPDAAEIYKVTVTHGTIGSSGTSELDIQWAAFGSASWASIFGTTPKVASTATADNAYVTGLSTPTGYTAPVLSKSTFAAGDKLRCRFVSSMAGSPNGFLIRLYFRPL